MKWTQEFLGWLYPSRCPACGDVIEAETEAAKICSRCREAFVRISPPVCFRCGRTTEEGTEFCTDCQGKKFSYLKGYPVFSYNQSMKKSIAAFKYHGRREYAAYYGQEFAKRYFTQIKQLSIDGFIPVPLYRDKYKKRGYNQAELFADEIGKWLEIPVYSDCLIRIRNTAAQKDLDDRQRYANLKKAFAFRHPSEISLQNVMLVDDIYTTGSTVEMCARVLLHAGIKRVYFAAVSIGS